MKTVRPFPTKDAAERAAFQQFAQQLGEVESWISVDSTNPPKPDLLCVHQDRGTVAFELVAITDPTIARVNAGYSDSGVADYCTSDPTERIIRNKLSREYESSFPVELLVYNDLLTITPDEIIVEIAINLLRSEDHPFQKAWFMGEFESKLIWRYDA